MQGLVLFKLERMEEALDIFQLITDYARDKDEPSSATGEDGRPKVTLRCATQCATNDGNDWMEPLF